MRLKQGAEIVAKDAKERILAFIGYGQLNARIWILGMEEAGGGEDNLTTRSQFNPVEDLYAAHPKLGITKHHEDSRTIQPQWGRMADLMLRLGGTKSPTREQRRNYQAEQLGRSYGDTLLVELMPVPKPNLSAFDYPETFPEYASASSYYQGVLPDRIRLLRKLIENHTPRVIVAYGSAFWRHYRSIMEPSFESVSNGFTVLSIQHTSMILIPFWTSRSMNGRLEALEETIRDVIKEHEESPTFVRTS